MTGRATRVPSTVRQMWFDKVVIPSELLCFCAVEPVVPQKFNEHEQGSILDQSRSLRDRPADSPTNREEHVQLPAEERIANSICIGTTEADSKVNDLSDDSSGAKSRIRDPFSFPPYGNVWSPTNSSARGHMSRMLYVAKPTDSWKTLRPTVGPISRMWFRMTPLGRLATALLVALQVRSLLKVSSERIIKHKMIRSAIALAWSGFDDHVTNGARIALCGSAWVLLRYVMSDHCEPHISFDAGETEQKPQKTRAKRGAFSKPWELLTDIAARTRVSRLLCDLRPLLVYAAAVEHVGVVSCAPIDLCEAAWSLVGAVVSNVHLPNSRKADVGDATSCPIALYDPRKYQMPRKQRVLVNQLSDEDLVRLVLRSLGHKTSQFSGASRTSDHRKRA